MKGSIREARGIFLRIESYEDDNEPIVYIGKNDSFLKKYKLKFLSRDADEHLSRQDIETYSFYNMEQAILYANLCSNEINNFIDKTNGHMTGIKYICRKAKITLCSSDLPDVDFDNINISA